MFKAIRDWGRAVLEGWRTFWFAASDPATLSLLRICCGAMLFYTHLVWSLDLMAFCGPQGWIGSEAWEALRGDRWLWSHLWLAQSSWLLWVMHIAALVVLLMFMLGLFSRTTAVLSYLIAVSYLNRISLADFGLDRVNVMLSMYIMLGPCGARYSLDRWWRKRHAAEPPEVLPTTSANVAVRLIQIHMCVIYFFAGTRKLLGVTWWDGSAMWLSAANLEYQTLDVTWLASYPLLVSMMTHITVLFEVSYAALIWPRLTRPLMLVLAAMLHLGIVIALGMPTFGLAMLIGNAAFLSPWFVRRLLEWRNAPTVSTA